MSNYKDQAAILSKLGIERLNPMQLEAHEAILSHSEVILLSPTGTGKTLAFLLPIIEQMDRHSKDIQVLILVPSRELAIQIESVTREMGSGFKANAVYGGKSGTKDKMELKHAPSILIGTPGRVSDHIRRGNIDPTHIHTLVLDEFDKSLEVGFEKEMMEITDKLRFLKKKIMTSATQKAEIPRFVRLKDPIKIDLLKDKLAGLKLKVVESKTDSKLTTLVKLLGHIGDKSGIVFCNFKDSIEVLSEYLDRNNIGHEVFYGGLEQIDRERALIKFRNKTSKLLIATDLAARGIDVPELDFIIHYEMPPRVDEFTHRNGRTARMHSSGSAYIIKGKFESLKAFASHAEEVVLSKDTRPVSSSWETLYISGGRKDKISKGDIAGLFFKQGGLQKEELGVIELKQEHAFVAVPKDKAEELIQKLNNSRIKKRKVRITLLA